MYVLDDADYNPTRRHEMDHTNHTNHTNRTDHTNHTDHTNQE